MFVSGTNIISLAETAEYFSGSPADAAQIEAVEAVEGEVQEAEEGSGSAEEDPGASGESDAAPSADKEDGKDASAAKQETKPESQKDITIKTADGELNYDEEWKKEYPYGAFAFAQTDGVICENGPEGTDSVLIPLYRVGSLEGRATAYVTYAAPVYQEEDGTINDMMALSLLRDATLEVEKSDPKAYYQKLAAPSMEPAPEGVTIGKKANEESSEAVVFYPVEADGTPLTADEYIWQTRPYESGWRSIKDSNEAELSIVLDGIMDGEGQFTQDYRLIYMKDGVRYCTPAAITGTPYDPLDDEDQKVPDDLPEYEPMTFETYEAEGLYDPLEITLTFGEGEFVKYLRVTALDDDYYGIDRIGVFTISGTEGGDACNLCETYTLSRVDDDLSDKEPTQLGFTFSEIKADRDSGEVTVFVKRTGDLRYPVAVKAETKDGTAVAGTDYTHTSQMLAFLGIQSLMEFKVPLIAGQAADVEKEFTVTLSDISGGSDLCSLYEPSSVKIILTSGGLLLGASENGLMADGMNLQSMLATAQGEDVSNRISVLEGGLLGTGGEVDYEQEEEREELQGSYVEDPNSYTYQNGVQIRRDSRYLETNEYWKDKEIVAGDSTSVNDSVEYRNSFRAPQYENNNEDCGGKYVFNNDYEANHEIRVSHNDSLTQPVTFSLPDAGLYFSQVYFKWKVSLAAIARYNGSKKMKDENDWRFIMPWVSINPGAKVPKKFEEGQYYYDFIPKHFTEDSRYPLTKSSYKATVTLQQEDPALDVKFGLQTNLNGRNNPAYDSSVPKWANASCQFDLKNMEFTRRVFSNTSTIGMTIHTANDADTGAQNPIDVEALYESIRPVVSLVPHESGVNSKGCLYAGSKIKVTMVNSASFKPYQGEKADDTVYVTRNDGSRVEGAQITQSADESDVYYITLLWDGMTAADLKEIYTVNVVLERRQKVQIDIRPSMDRNINKTIDYSPEALKSSWDRFLTDKDGKDHEVTITVGKKTEEYPFFKDKTVTTGSAEYKNTLRSLLTQTDGVAQLDWNSVPGLKNIQSVNFGLDEEDVILFNGHLYAGNETILFKKSDLSLSLLNFVFYDSDFMDQESIMEATLVEEQYYYDANGNGKIDGFFNEETGFFETAPESGDFYVGDADGRINELMLTPEINDDGTVRQFILRSFYTMTPRALKGDDTKKVQMLPVFLPSLVDPIAIDELTEEQRSFRCIKAAPTQIKEYDDKSGMLSPARDVEISSDGHAMYGAAATKLSYVDIPLGGNTEIYSEMSGGEIPEYSGHLRVGYSSPSDIYITGADGLPDKVEDTNGYLGSFCGNTTYALYLQEQVEISSMEDIVPESITEGTAETMTNGNGAGGIDAVPSKDYGFSGNDGGAGLGYGININEAAPLPTIDFSAFGFTLSMVNDNQLWLSYNIPVFEASAEKEWSHQKKENIRHNQEDVFSNADGSRTTIETDVRGNVVSTTFEDNIKEVDATGPAGDQHTYYQETSRKYVKDQYGNVQVYQHTSDRYYYSTTGKKIYDGNRIEKDEYLCEVPDLPQKYEKSSKWKTDKGRVKPSTSFGFDKDTMDAMEDFLNGNSGLLNNSESKKASSGRSCTTAKVTFTVSIKLLVVFERDTISGEWSVPRGSIALVGTLFVEISHRFACCPAIYVFIRFTASVSAEFQMSQQLVQDGDSYTVQESDITYHKASGSGGTWNIEPGGYIVFGLKGGNYPRKSGFSMYLDGSIVMIASETDKFTSEVKKGHFQAQGDTVNANLAGYSDAQFIMLKNNGDTSVTVGQLALADFNSTYFSPDGMKFRLSLSFQLCGGVGIGFSMMNAEAYVQGLLKLVFETTSGGFGLTTFYAGASAVLSVKFFFFSVSFDLVGHYWEKNRQSTADEWITDDYWVFGSQKHQLNANEAESPGAYAMPENTAGRQAFYDSYDEEEETNAFHPTDTEVKFDISGYSSGADAFKLADHLDTGGEYKALSVDGDTYILYHVAVSEAGNVLNQHQLALSRVVTNGEHPGIENPVDPKAAKPYILVNEPAAADQYMGVHAFSFGVEGKKLTVVWTGYDRHFKDSDKLTAEEVSDYLVTKSASITLGGEEKAFSEPVLISDAAPKYRYAAAVSGDVKVFAENRGTSSNGSRDEMMREYLKGRFGVSEAELDTGIANENEPSHQEPVARYVSQRALTEAFGDGSTLVAVLPDGTKVSQDIGINGEHIVDLSFAEIDGHYLAIYSTDQDVFVDSNGGAITSGFNEESGTAVFHRLYARELDVSGKAWDDAQLLYTCADFENCTSDNIDTCAAKDGIYQGTALMKEQVDPSINALKFIDADMDGNGAKTVFIFGFTGNTYLLRNDSLKGIINGGAITMEPFFDNQIGYGASLASDSEGNLVMAYLKAVEGTNSNGLFCAWWDSKLGVWGEPYLLAMNRMSVYENAKRFGLEGEDITKAFLGKETGNEEYNAFVKTLTDERDKGAYDRFVFSDITVLAIARDFIEDDAAIEVDEETGEEIFSNEASNALQKKEQLIILTGGVWSELDDTKLEFKTLGDDGTLETVPELTEDGVTLKRDDGLGYYAICFGSGEPDIGQEFISLQDEAFSAGKRLKGQVGFTNTGSATIRGSAQYPVSVDLIARANGKSAVLSSWSINDMIPSGRDVVLELSSRELVQNLEDGTELFLSVSEDKEYIESTGGTPFSKAGKTVYVVGGSPDIGIESAAFEAVSADDDRVYANVDLDVTNRGASGTDHLYVQFTYKDAAGVMRPLDITGSRLSVAEQEPIKTLEAGTRTDEKNGIFELKDKRGKSDLSSGFKRHVNGVLSMPKEIFLADEDNGVTVCMNVFSDADVTVTEDDVIRIVRSTDKYLDNNTITTGFDQQTFFVVPSQTGMSVHNTLHTIFSFTSTKRESDISIREISNGTEEWMPLLDILYYDTFLGCIVATATAPGSTVIQIEDLLTGSFRQVVLKVTDDGAGINIFPDDYAFRFYDKDGTLVGRGANSLYWNFYEDMDSWAGGGGAPMNHDVVSLKQLGGYFEFETAASYLELYMSYDADIYIKEFNETVTVGAHWKTPGKLSFTDLFPEKYAEGMLLTVRITPLRVDQQIDKYTAVYPQDPGVLTRSSDRAPMFYWDRSFPNTASVQEGDSVALTCYITTPYALEKCIWNGTDVTDWPDYVTKREPMWIFEPLIEENGSNTLEVYDIYGNYTKQEFPVRWFAKKPAEDAVSACPEAFDCIIVNEHYSPIMVLTEEPGFAEDSGTLYMNSKNTRVWTNAYNAVDFKNAKHLLQTNRKDSYVKAKWYWTCCELPCSGYYVMRETDTYGKWRQRVEVCNRISDAGLPSDDPRRMHLLSYKIEDHILKLDIDNLYNASIYTNDREGMVGPEYSRTFLEYPVRYGGHYYFDYIDGGSVHRYSVDVPAMPIKGLGNVVLVEKTERGSYKIMIDDPEKRMEGGYSDSYYYKTISCEFGILKLESREDPVDYRKFEWKNWSDLTAEVSGGIYAVAVRSAMGYEDPVYDQLIVDTSEIGTEPISGTVTITGEMIEGETLKAEVSDMNYKGTLRYQWQCFEKRDGKEVNNYIFAGETSDTFYLDPKDFIVPGNGIHLTRYVRCVVTSTMSPGSCEASSEEPVLPALEKECEVNTEARYESDYMVDLPVKVNYSSITYLNGSKGSRLIPGVFRFPCMRTNFGIEDEYILRVLGDLTNKKLNIELENEKFTYTGEQQTCRVKGVSYNFVDSVPFHVVRGDTATTSGTHKMLIEFDSPYSGFKVIRWTIDPRERRVIIDPTKPEKDGDSESSHTSSYTEKPTETQLAGAKRMIGRWQQASDGSWKFLNSDGSTFTGWGYISTANGWDYYHLRADGVMDSGWYFDEGLKKWYYLNEQHDGRFGAMMRGWHLDARDDRWYYLDPKTGEMSTGWVQVSGKWYYLSPGSTVPAWIKNEKGEWVYSGTGRAAGSMYANEKTPDGYTVDATGAWTGK